MCDACETKELDVDELRRSLPFGDDECESAIVEIERLRAEIERLRAALRQADYWLSKFTGLPVEDAKLVIGEALDDRQ